MPVLSSNFAPNPLLCGSFLQTVYPNQLRKVPCPAYNRERIATEDGDFLDLDWLQSGSQRLAILTHGLEGSSRSVYLAGLAHALHRAGWDVLAWNMRGCSGEPNRRIFWYHSGKSEDLRLVIRHASAAYSSVVLVGISVGGNITLKYLGEQGAAASRNISAAVCFSVPCDLTGAAEALAKRRNILYMRHFMVRLKEKVIHKARQFPELLKKPGLNGLRTFADFDGRFTAPLNGFGSASEYWRKASSAPLLSEIRIPTLLVNAANDPFLGERSFPYDSARANPYLFVEVPECGGHMGFCGRGPQRWWAEVRTQAFLGEVLAHTVISRADM